MHAPVPRLAPRTLARVIDTAVVIGIDGALGRWIGFGFDWLVLGAVVVYAWFVVGDLLGGTIGKRALGMRVVGPDGGRPTLRQAALREAFTVVGAIPFVGPLLAFAAWGGIVRGLLSDEAARGWHDRLAGTRVVWR